MTTRLGYDFEGDFRNLRPTSYNCRNGDDLIKTIFLESRIIVAMEGWTSENLDMLTDKESPLDYISGPEALNNVYDLSLKKRSRLIPDDKGNSIMYADIDYDGGGDWGISLGGINERLDETSKYIEENLLKMKAKSYMNSWGIIFADQFVKLSYYLSNNDIAHYMIHNFRGQRSFMVGHNPREDILISNGGLFNF